MQQIPALHIVHPCLMLLWVSFNLGGVVWGRVRVAPRSCFQDQMHSNLPVFPVLFKFLIALHTAVNPLLLGCPPQERTYYFLVANAKFMLFEEEQAMELLREKRRTNAPLRGHSGPPLCSEAFRRAKICRENSDRNRNRIARKSCSYNRSTPDCGYKEPSLAVTPDHSLMHLTTPSPRIWPHFQPPRPPEGPFMGERRIVCHTKSKRPTKFPSGHI